MLSSHSQAIVSRQSIVSGVFLLLFASVSAQQLTIREIAYLRDSGLMKPEDVASAYDQQMSNDKIQLYRSAVRKLMDGEERSTVEAFLKTLDSSASKEAVQNSTSLLGGGACPPDVCKNMAICIPADKESNRAFTCLCPDGYFGESCQYDVIECIRQPCLHDGDCRKEAESEKGYKCVCAVGYTGEYCEMILILGGAKGQEEEVAGGPTFRSYVALWCLVVLACGFSLVIAVEAERRLMLARYKLYTSLGYPIPFPRLEFGRMMLSIFRRIPFCPACCFPEEEYELPEIPGYVAVTQTEPMQIGRVSVAKP